jgi:hypothetical protein
MVTSKDADESPLIERGQRFPEIPVKGWMVPAMFRERWASTSSRDWSKHCIFDGPAISELSTNNNCALKHIFAALKA